MSESSDRLVSSYQYRKNGFEYINGSDGEIRKNRYGRLAEIQQYLVDKEVSADHVKGEEKVTSGSEGHAIRYTFAYENPQTKEINFSPDTKACTPYRHQGHHLIPIDFKSLLTDPKVQAIADKVEININRGQNIIFLPENDKSTGYHNLPYHCGSHDKYSSQVKRDAKDLTKKLKEYVDDNPCAPEQDLPKDVVDEFDGYSNDLWDIVSKAGRKSVNAIKKKRKRLLKFEKVHY